MQNYESGHISSIRNLVLVEKSKRLIDPMLNKLSFCFLSWIFYPLWRHYTVLNLILVSNQIFLFPWRGFLWASTNALSTVSKDTLPRLSLPWLLLKNSWFTLRRNQEPVLQTAASCKRSDERLRHWLIPVFLQKYSGRFKCQREITVWISASIAIQINTHLYITCKMSKWPANVDDIYCHSQYFCGLESIF